MDFDRNIDPWMDSDMIISDRTGSMAEFTPTCDMEESADHYSFSFDLPGVKKSDIKVEIYDNRLHVTGERRTEIKEEVGTRRVLERRYGRFERLIPLSAAVNDKGVEALFDNGVLTVVVPKTKEARSKTIAIKSAEQSH
jgi:HSP20 family protein